MQTFNKKSAKIALFYKIRDFSHIFSHIFSPFFSRIFLAHSPTVTRQSPDSQPTVGIQSPVGH